MSCPICAKDPVAAYQPFCSKRCADVDLGRWLKGRYAIVDNSPESQDEAARELPQEHPARH